MTTTEIIEASRRLVKPYRINHGKKFRLKDFDPGDTGELKSADKPRAKEVLEMGVHALAELQDVLYAQDRWSLLLIFQAMDAAGKDGTIKHVMSGVNPQGCQVYILQGAVERGPRARLPLALHARRCPSAGASASSTARYYEEMLVVRVHPEFLVRKSFPRVRDKRSGSIATTTSGISNAT